jgi:Zn2+/Cd2+-exporting ATPase
MGQRSSRDRATSDSEGADVRRRLRVTAWVLAGLIAGMILEWGPVEPSRWRWLPLGAAYLIGGGPIARGTWRDLKKGRLSIDFLMGAAAVGAAAVGNPIEGVVLIFLFSLSNALEAYAMGRTRSALSMLATLRPDSATVIDEQGREIGRRDASELTVNMRLLVRPGERIAADGTVEQGESEVDQSPITGESMPVRKTPSEQVFAGTLNGPGALIVRVGRGPEETMLARIIALVKDARATRAPAQQFIDRFAHPYTIGVVTATAVTFLYFFWIGGRAWDIALYRAISLLVVASPCALVISTPSAVLSAIANGARHGILFKGGAYLDLAGRIRTIAFDKTGTLTHGTPRLLALRTTDDTFSSEDLLQHAAAVEQASEHHLARAIVEGCRRKGLEPLVADSVEAVPGVGVTGYVQGESLWVGNDTMAERMKADPSAALSGWAAEQSGRGRTVVWVGRHDRIMGALSLADTLRPRAAATIRHLKQEGIQWVVMLTGDHPEVAQGVAAQLGIDEVRAGLLPHEKVEIVRELTTSHGGVAMVGDGVNDAPAMVASSLGIAMGAAGTDVAIETADVVLMSDDIEKVDYVIHLGNRSLRIVRQNVWFSVGWMGMLVILSLAVGIPLPLAVIGHEGSTLLVAANGLRLLAGQPHAPTARARGH